MGKKTYDKKAAFADLLVGQVLVLNDPVGAKIAQKIVVEFQAVQEEQKKLEKLTNQMHELRESSAKRSAKATALMEMIFEDHGKEFEEQIKQRARVALKAGESLDSDLQKEIEVEDEIAEAAEGEQIVGLDEVSDGEESEEDKTRVNVKAQKRAKTKPKRS